MPEKYFVHVSEYDFNINCFRGEEKEAKRTAAILCPLQGSVNDDGEKHGPHEHDTPHRIDNALTVSDPASNEFQSLIQKNNGYREFHYRNPFIKCKGSYLENSL